MNGNPFEVFIDLVNFDQKTVGFQKSIEKIKKEIDILKEQQKELESDMQNSKYALHELQKDVDMRELEMSELDLMESDKKKRLDQTSNQKEYISIKKEIENISKKRHESEDPLLDAWNKLEVSKQTFKEKESSYDKKMIDLNKKIEEKEKELSQLQIDLKGHNKQRRDKEKLVNPEWLEKYSLMHSRVSNPVVVVQQGSCSACFYKVTSQLLIELRKRKMVNCKGCYRFLYLEPQEE